MESTSRLFHCADVPGARFLMLLFFLLFLVVNAEAQDFSKTILVTYKHDCLEESTRLSLVGRSVQAAVLGAARGAREIGSRIVRSSLEDHHLSVSSSFSFQAGSEEVRLPENSDGCRIDEVWLKHIGLQLISLVGSCERIGKEELMGRLALEECVLSREMDSVRYPTGSMRDSQHQKAAVVAAAERRLFVPNDPSFGNQWHLDDSNPFSVGAQAAWDISVGGDGSEEQQPDNTVGVVDFGFMQDHPDLQTNWWTNPLENCEANGKNNLDEDENGFVDDCNGWNMATNSNDLSGYSHGTKVSGCLGAVSSNGVGIAGICSKCRMLPVTVSGSVSSELAGVNYILSKGVRIVNLSVGGARSEAEYNTFSQNSHALFVVAAGNEACDLDKIADVPCKDKYGSDAGYPASLSSDLSNVLSVGAIQSNGSKSSFSSYGATRVQVFAPGSSILTTSISGGAASYSSRSGTSYASPIVAGIAGLVLQKHPSITACQLRLALIQSCRENSLLTGMTACNGQVNASDALAEGLKIAVYPMLYPCDAERMNEESDSVTGSKRFRKPIPLSNVSVKLYKTDQVSVKIKDPTMPKVGAKTKAKKTIAGVVAKGGSGHMSKNADLKAKYTKSSKSKSVSAFKNSTRKDEKSHSSGVMMPMQDGEFFLEAIVAALTKSSILVNANVLDITISLLLELFTNLVDPLALLTSGKPVKQYLDEVDKSITNNAYAHLGNNGSRGPINVLLNPLSNANKFLASQKGKSSSKSTVALPLDFGFGTNVLEPLVFGKMLAMEMTNLGLDVGLPKGKPKTSSTETSDIRLLDPLQLLIANKQLKIFKKALALAPLDLLALESDSGVMDIINVPLSFLDPLSILRGVTEAES